MANQTYCDVDGIKTVPANLEEQEADYAAHSRDADEVLRERYEREQEASDGEVVEHLRKLVK